MSISIVEFGRQVARALGNGINENRLTHQEAAVVEFALRRQRRWTSAPGWQWAAASMLLLCAAGVALYLGIDEQPDNEASLQHRPEGIGSGAAPSSGLRWLDLADGSRLGADPQTHVEVLEQPDVRVRLISGQVNVKVAKQHDRDWVLLAGPYRIAVVGTQFDVSFDAQSEGFEVRVTEGLVRVFGGDLPTTGLSLREGQVYASGDSIAPAAAEVSSGVTVEPAGRDSEVTHSLPSKAQPHPTKLLDVSKDAVEATSLDWQQSCASGRYSEAFPPGNIENFQGLLEQSAEGQLLQLANCLRYAGRSPDAKRALSRLRERFPRSPGAILASYHLARLSQRESNTEAATRWFETYLAESPRGQLAAGARAELVRLWLKQGNTTRARTAAQDYLRLHPTGSFASQAQEVLDSAAASK